ncbi:MAG: nicotinamide-nucleotide amidase [Thiogranum sp.]
MAEALADLATGLAAALRRRGEWLVTAESCTGGWVAKICTDLAGSSAWFERGFVTYSNDSKQEMLGVSAETLDRYGAVSEQVVQEMAAGALQNSHAQWALAISGLAGPGGGSGEKPLGTVCFAWAGPDGWVMNRRYRFDGDREAVRRQAVSTALSLLTAHLN